MPALILLADHTGRLGNKCILYSHVIAAAEEYGCRVINLSILPAAHIFEGLHLNPLGAYPRQFFPFDIRWLTRAFRQLIQRWVLNRRSKGPVAGSWVTLLDRENQPNLDLHSEEFRQLTLSTKLIVLWGWSFRCSDLVKKHAEIIRPFFRIRAATAPWAKNQVSEAAKKNLQTLAVHIRQGDFRTWEGGKHFVPPERFALYINNRLSSASTTHRVWICSDEPVAAELFHHIDRQILPRPLREDLYLMANADILLAGESSLAYFLSFLRHGDSFRLHPTQTSLEEIHADGL